MVAYLVPIRGTQCWLPGVNYVCGRLPNRRRIAANGSGSWVAQFSCRLDRHRPEVVAGDNLGAIRSTSPANFIVAGHP
jgi:hypothetical protein